MNHPISNPRPITNGAVALLLVTDHPELVSLAHAKDTLAPTLAPIDADIAREEAEEAARKTGTPYQIHKDLLANAAHTKKDVNQLVFAKWLQDRGWPEEHHDRFGPYLMKFFRAHDGWAVKWVPYDDQGKLMASKAVYEVFTFVRDK